MEELQFWVQALEDSRRTRLCAPGRVDQVRQLLDAYGVAGLYDAHAAN